MKKDRNSQALGNCALKGVGVGAIGSREELNSNSSSAITSRVTLGKLLVLPGCQFSHPCSFGAPAWRMGTGPPGLSAQAAPPWAGSNPQCCSKDKTSSKISSERGTTDGQSSRSRSAAAAPSVPGHDWKLGLPGAHFRVPSRQLGGLLSIAGSAGAAGELGPEPRWDGASFGVCP